ncbi:MAG: RseA family anti-sigma factor [Rhodocyclaceae bacterium]|nr:RseA family anti-sigma factor [Rhodocyclaceae bacterium]
MKLERSTEISALFDGELEEHEVRSAVRTALNDDASWRMYALIGDGLRGDCPDAPDMTAGVMSRIREEPVVLAPRNLQPVRRQHPMLALAASVAGVAVVGWLALAGKSQLSPADNQIAAVPVLRGSPAGAVSPAPTFVKVPQGMPGDMNEYLLAHHAQATTIRLGDSTKQVRTVAMSSARP